jgi:hypothetical protein
MKRLSRRGAMAAAALPQGGAALAACGAPGAGGPPVAPTADLGKVNRRLMVWTT